MEIHGKDVSVEDIIGKEDLHTNLSKLRDNKLMLSDYQVSILERNQIPYPQVFRPEPAAQAG